MMMCLGLLVVYIRHPNIPPTFWTGFYTLQFLQNFTISHTEFLQNFPTTSLQFLRSKAVSPRRKIRTPPGALTPLMERFLVLRYGHWSLAGYPHVRCGGSSSCKMYICVHYSLAIFYTFSN